MGNLGSAHRVDGERTGEHTGLVTLGHPLDLGLTLSGDDVLPGLGLGLGAVDERLHQRMLGSEDTEGHSENCVGSCREHVERISPLDIDAERRALGAADPVPLHGAHPVGPVLQLLDVVEQTIGIVGDLEEPLGKVLLDDGCVATLAETVDYLFVGQNRLILGTPIDRRLGLVGQTTLVELEDEPLVPAIEIGLMGCELSIPVVHRPELSDLSRHRGDLILGVGLGMNAAVDRSVLRG